VAGPGDTRDARELLAQLVGRPLQTLSGAPNEILELRDRDVIVATGRSPAGQPVPIAWVQEALDRLYAEGELRIDVPTVGHRSALVGAVIRTLPGARVERNPQRIVLDGLSAGWDVPLGAVLSRAERKERFGGSTQRGIEPSTTTPNVFVYSDPAKGESYGYNFDGWSDRDQVFLYTGEGRQGDQRMTGGNRAILEHRTQGRALRLFVADGHVEGTGQRQHRYIGEFEIDEETPYAVEDAPDENGESRTVFVFRLRPVGETLRRETDDSEFPDVDGRPAASLVALEENVNASFDVGPREETTATRREGELVDRYIAWAGSSQSFGRWSIRPPGELVTLVTDIYSETHNVLFEAKGTATRGAIREAIGQLLDYRRYIHREGLRLAVLLPHLPSQDLIDLATGLGIAVVAEQSGGGFEPIEP
jgi:hypothetical protein